MIRRIRYISYLLVLHTLLLSSDIVLFDLDVIENNQLLLNSENTSILDTLSFGSIVFNQDHHLPYGTFLFNESREIQKPDTVSHLSQFIHKKGDYRYRDLVVSLVKINKDNVSYQLLAQNKSFTPLSIYNVSGKGFLQNFLFDIKKETDDKYLSGSIAFHKENPYLPISYNFNSSDQGVFNTRKAESVLWGFTFKKDIGKKLSISSDLLNRHPFPGPGLAIRIPGEIDRKKIDILQRVDNHFISYLKEKNIYKKIWQAFAILLPVKSVGVMGDERTYSYSIAIRAVTSVDGMTADFYMFSKEDLTEISKKIISNVKEVNRVLYDFTSKPPGTIEWE